MRPVDARRRAARSEDPPVQLDRHLEGPGPDDPDLAWEPAPEVGDQVREAPRRGGTDTT